MRKVLLVICVMLFVSSCGSKKQVSSTKNKKGANTERVVKKPKTRTTSPNIEGGKSPTRTVKNAGSPVEMYIQLYFPIAQNEMRLYGVPASITLAQGILESGSGTGRLAMQANNHFGIKCHGWSGAKIYHDDDTSQECFRKYNDPRYSFRDHSLFLSERKRYYRLFELKKDDYKGWARELRKAGYATDRKYPDKLISLIERYELYKFDETILGKETSVSENNLTHQVVKGDTLYSLSKRYNTSVENLKVINNLTSNELKIGAILLIKVD